jgi:malonate-semialdehyde dehydrogenase (acetylating)/methylmalonate-semialdehyde dehydrogenase
MSAPIDSWSTRQPLGVVAGITPFNFPAMVPMWMFPMALACRQLLHPEAVRARPLGSLLMAELAEGSGPARWRVQRRPWRQGPRSMRSSPIPGIEAVSFVGSTPIAEYIYTTGTAHGKRVQALGGAKNHMIVMPDADMTRPSDALMGAGYGSAGERCMAISVAVAVGDKTATRWSSQAGARARLKVGPGTDPEAEMGPLVTKQHYEKVKGYVDRASRKAPSWWSTAAASSCRATRTATSSAAACSTT